MEMNKNNAMVTEIQSTIYKKLRSIADGQGTYAILDFPDYQNVGDSAIYLGERKALSDIFCRPPSYVSSITSHNNSDLDRELKDGVIFLNGGGNFGDIWPRHQKFREDIIQHHLRRKIVQLPVSIHFKQVAARDACARVIDQHSAFTLLVRDAESFEVAQAHFDCDVQMCPDAAFALGPLNRTVEPEHKAIALIRTDIESRFHSQNTSQIAAGGPVEDWVVDTPHMKSKLDRLTQRGSIESRHVSRLLRQRLNKIYDAWAQDRLSRGVKQLSRGEYIITDRLHVHILSTLLGIPHLVLDNNNRKISRYMDAWPDCHLGTIVDDLDTAREVLDAREA